MIRAITEEWFETERSDVMAKRAARRELATALVEAAVAAGEGNGRVLPAGDTPTCRIEMPSAHKITIPIVGIAPYVGHGWDAKSRMKMLKAQQVEGGTGPKRAKQPRDPAAEYAAARYVCNRGQPDEWDGIPVTAFKASMVGACRQVAGLAMTDARRILFVHGQGVTYYHSPTSCRTEIELVRIIGTAEMREDAVRIDRGKSTDLRYRPHYWPWSAVVIIEFNASRLKPDAVVNLLATAGFWEGVGEGRPGSKDSNSGQWGRWKLDEANLPV